MYKIVFLFLCAILILISADHQDVCQDDLVSVRCPRGHRFRPFKAIYGRENTAACDSSDGKCGNQEDCLQKVKDRCDEAKHCIFWVNNTYCGNDPCPGIQKYLDLDYECYKVQ